MIVVGVGGFGESCCGGCECLDRGVDFVEG